LQEEKKSKKYNKTQYGSINGRRSGTEL